MSDTVNGIPNPNDEKISPCHAAYYASDPSQYCELVKLSYSPEVAVLPQYTQTVFDCACLYGNTSLALMYGWNFNRSVEYWKKGNPLTEDEKKATLLGHRIHIIGLDGSATAVEYSKNMNIIDEGIVQNFEHDMSPETKAGLEKSDVWVMQQCLSYMPMENLKIWLTAFLSDRSRPKRFIYDFNPYFDTRDMAPKMILEGFSDWEISMQKFYAYRQKTDEEYATSQENGRDMCVHHYVVDFAAIQP